MKWLLAIGITIVSLTTGNFPYGENAKANDLEITRSVETPTTISKVGIVDYVFGLDTKKPTTLIEKQYRHDQAQLAVLIDNQQKIERVVAELKSRIGKTWYVFSGHTPQGWDCSGLVYWAYEQLGVPVEHSANKQGHSGTKVKTAKVGDIVVFGYKGSGSYYHAAIYVGDNKVIHAGFRKGTTTQIISLDDPAFQDSTITFVRLIDTP